MDNIFNSKISRRTLLGGSVATGALLAAGCGGDTPGSASSTLRVGVPTDVLLSAVQRFNPSNRPLRRTVFDYLIDRKPDGSYVGELASGWEFSSDNKTLVLTLREGVTYHDGRAFGPDDVVASIQIALLKESGVQGATLLRRASGVKATGKSQVTITFEEPFRAYLDALAMLPIIDEKTYSQIASGDRVNGTGPFSWKSWTAGREVQLARNASYWQEGKPYVDGVVLNVITSSQAMLAAMRSGDQDLANQMLARDAAALKKDSGFSVTTTAGYDTYVGVNTKVKPLDDVRVRQAIAYALDRERIADQVYSGFAEPSCIPWSADTPGVSQEQITRYSYNIDKARSLIQAAGATGAEVAVSPSAQDPSYGAVGDIVHYGLEQIGLKPKTVMFDAAETPKNMQAGTWPGVWVSIVGLTTMGPVTTLLTANPLRTDKNTHNFTPPEYQSLVGDVTGAPDPQALATATGALTEYMLEEAFHNTVVQAPTPLVSTSRLSGVRADATLSLILTDAKFNS